MAVAFAPNGNVFVAEKRGVILRYSSATSTTPVVFADLNTNVHNYWDRGLLGLAVHPQYPSQPYVYVLYAYNHILGDSTPAPRWPANSPGSYADSCPTPPGGTTDGCVISGRLSRLTSSGGVMTGPEDVLIEDWCQQFPSHSVGNLMFGPEGALYVSAGDGAGFNGVDYGQRGGTLSDTPTPTNPCGDPPTGPGTTLTAPTAEGGALRAQDLRTSGDPVGLDGAVLRLNPTTGAGWPSNALAGSSDTNARKIIGYGLRNPFRFTIRPGTSEVWLADVGFAEWEEIDRLPNPDAAARNFGWPCYEGAPAMPGYQNLGLAICSGLSSSEVTSPYYAYAHRTPIVSGDGCGTGSSSISGIAFLSTSSDYPARYDGGLFYTDYARRCIWMLPAGSGGLPTAGSPELFANLNRATPDVPGGSVFLTTAPDGDLVYVDYDRGEVRKIHYYGVASPPVASFTATPASGPTPLQVSFDASASTTDVGQLTYAWDLDGDGQYDDATGKTTQRTYTVVENVTVGLEVRNTAGLTGTASKVIAVGNTKPTVSITAPSASLQWKVNDSIAFSGSATDMQDGTLPASAFEWTLTMEHCPSDCHSHIIETYSATKSGNFDAPDHELPSHLKLSLTVTDSGGLSATKAVQIYPQSGTITSKSSPSGIKTTVDGKTGSNPSVTGIVGSVLNVSAPATAKVGEGNWAFQSWSDAGARNHAVTITPGTTSLTATYSFTGSTDISNTCSGAASPVGPSGKWQVGTFGTTNDVDWYRFKLNKTKRVRLVLGDLAVPGRMALYKGCSTLLKVADRSGTGAEQIIKKLAAGTYAIRVSGSGTPSTGNYSVLMKKLPAAVRVLTSNALIKGSTLRLVGEVYDNTTRTVGPVRVTAKLYNAAGTLLTTRSTIVDLRFDKPRRRAPFSVTGSLPAAYDHVKWSVDAPPTGKRIVAPGRTVTSSGPDGDDRWVVRGTIRNTKAYTVRKLRFTVTLYDDRGDVLDVVRAQVGTRTLTPGASTTFVGKFTTTGLKPDRIYTRGMAVR
ncbi:MAG: PQQ-dependent sugar dehydrogenase [Chloroflexi bacterium]|nr:PQQ-dependent sugar dehydrogenase [Chloroflexota bacterium]